MQSLLQRLRAEPTLELAIESAPNYRVSSRVESQLQQLRTEPALQLAQVSSLKVVLELALHCRHESSGGVRGVLTPSVCSKKNIEKSIQYKFSIQNKSLNGKGHYGRIRTKNTQNFWGLRPRTPAVAPSVALRANSVAMCNEICAPCQASPPPLRNIKLDLCRSPLKLALLSVILLY